MKDSSFNSRTLGRVRQTRSNSQNYRPLFQFAHPGKGATSSVRALFHEHIRFNSRTLGRVRLAECFRRWLLYLLVSIHAPWEGCDGVLGLQRVGNKVFQFTHPGKGATEAVTTIALVCCCFNSRTLGRVRHLPTICRLLHSISFNSRTLGRVRRRRHLRDPPCWSFNSRTLGRVRQTYSVSGSYQG